MQLKEHCFDFKYQMYNEPTHYRKKLLFKKGHGCHTQYISFSSKHFAKLLNQGVEHSNIFLYSLVYRPDKKMNYIIMRAITAAEEIKLKTDPKHAGLFKKGHGRFAPKTTIPTPPVVQPSVNESASDTL